MASAITAACVTANQAIESRTRALVPAIAIERSRVLS
jgi:hypothetical protein